MKRHAVWIGFFAFGLFQPILPAQSPATANDGVYTAAQAQQGKELYNKQCSMCHGPTLQGMGQNSPLSGSDFIDKWNDQTLADLYAKIHSSMPATNPGSLSPEETAQAIAYILSSNKFPAGKTVLPGDEALLEKINIGKPKS